MPLTVLTDNNVREILHGLKKEDVETIAFALAEALHSYSTGDTNSPCCSNYQPQRTVLTKNGITSLFMPATTGTSVGMKIISLEAQPTPPISSAASVASTKSSISSATTAVDNMQLTPTSRQSTTSSDAPSISGSDFRPPPSLNSEKSSTARGSVTLLDSNGYPQGIVNAEELTAFRTSLGAIFMLTKRATVHTITCFGAGKLAYWHIRLALILRAEEIHHVNIINRSFDKAVRLMKRFQVGHGGREEWKHVKFSVVSPEFGEYGRLLKEEIRKADVIFCTTPSTEPLFPHEFLTSHEGRRKGRYISAVGSFAPHMIELHPEIIKQAVKHEHSTGHHRHFHKHARSEGVIVVDTLDGCLKEAGEIIQAGVKPDQLVEVGELIMVKRAIHKELEMGGEGDKGLWEWLQKGNVIYKSVGLGLMDLVAAGELVRIARERDIGTMVEDF